MGGGSGWGDEGLKKGGGSGAYGMNLGGEGLGHQPVRDSVFYLPMSRKKDKTDRFIRRNGIDAQPSRVVWPFPWTSGAEKC